MHAMQPLFHVRLHHITSCHLRPKSLNDDHVLALRRLSCVKSSEGLDSAGVPERRIALRALVPRGTTA